MRLGLICHYFILIYANNCFCLRPMAKQTLLILKLLFRWGHLVIKLSVQIIRSIHHRPCIFILNLFVQAVKQVRQLLNVDTISERVLNVVENIRANVGKAKDSFSSLISNATGGRSEITFSFFAAGSNCNGAAYFLPTSKQPRVIFKLFSLHTSEPALADRQH